MHQPRASNETKRTMLRRIPQYWTWRFLLGFFFQTIPAAILTPLLTLTLAERGVEAWIIGSLVAAGSLSYMLALAATPGLVRRYGQQPVFRAALALGTLALVGLTLVERPLLLAGGFALAGFTAGLRFTLAESWVPALAAPEARGRVMALFQTSIGAALFVGAGSLLVTGINGPTPRLLALATGLAALALLWPMRAPAAAREAPLKTGLRGALAQVGPLALGMALLGGLFESGLSVALPLYGLQIGLGSTLAAGIVTAMGLGSLAQYPFGALADRWPWRRVIVATTVVIALSALLLPLARGAPWLLLLLGVVWGSAGGGLYTLVTIRNSARLRGERLITASAVTQFAYMIGDASGPAIGGAALDLAPGFGLPALVIGAGLLGLALILGMTGPARGQHLSPLPCALPRPARTRHRVRAHTSRVTSSGAGSAGSLPAQNPAGELPALPG